MNVAQKYTGIGVPETLARLRDPRVISLFRKVRTLWVSIFKEAPGRRIPVGESAVVAGESSGTVLGNPGVAIGNSDV